MVHDVEDRTTNVRAVPPATLGSVLHERNLRLLVTGQVVSALGDACYLVALPFLLFEQGGGAGTLAATLTVFGIARLVSALPAGAVVDAVGPRPVMLTADAVRAVAVAVLAAIALGGDVPTVLVMCVSAVLGLAEGCFQPASQSMTPSIVADAALPAANSVLMSGTLLAGAVGPVFAGISVAALSPAAVIAVDAATFVVSAAALLRMRVPRVGTGAGDAADATDRTTVAAFARSSTFFRTVVVMLAVLGLTIPGTLEVALPVLAHDRPQLGASGYGLLMTGIGVGLVCGGLAGSVAARTPRPGLVVVVLLMVDAGFLALLPVVTSALGALVVSVLLGVGDGALGVIVLTALQRMPPPHLRGRIMAVLAFTTFAMYPLSVALAGALLRAAGSSAMFTVGCCGLLAIALIGLASRSVRDADLAAPNGRAEVPG